MNLPEGDCEYFRIRKVERRELSSLVDLERRSSSKERRRGGLDWVRLFQGADYESVCEIINDSKILELEPGSGLLQVGDFNDSIFVVLSGLLEVLIGESASSARVFQIAAGECLGEMSAIDGKAVSASIRAATHSRILQLSPHVFWNQLMAIPGVARNVMSILAERMRHNNNVILDGQRKQLELEKLRHELENARQLQMGMLPPAPFFPERNDIEVSGKMTAASFVGGDFFDVFFIGKDRLFFCIGDVSGHGIAAAMFMARAITLIRIAAFSEVGPAEIIKRVNQQLCNANETCLFVTLLCGFFEIDSGRLVYSNAGHLPPLRWKDGVIDIMPIPKGPLVGIFPEGQFYNQEAQLDENDFFVMFTDGVTEASAPSGEEFSEERLIQVLHGASWMPLDGILDHIYKQVVSYSKESLLEDDCTLLAIRRRI